MVWMIFAFSVITINDISAYMCGFFLGSTPLIVLSPKKTVEGFVGGGLATLVLGQTESMWLWAFIITSLEVVFLIKKPGLHPSFLHCSICQT